MGLKKKESQGLAVSITDGSSRLALIKNECYSLMKAL
jgi:hypothetical protein